MAIFTIKDRDSDNQVKVDSEGNLYVRPSGSGGLNNVNIFDSAGNPITSTGGSLNVLAGGGWSNFAQRTPKIVVVGSASTLLLDVNPDRLYASFTNNTTQLIYLQYAIAAVWQSGQPLPQNSTWEINTTSLFQGQVYGITDSGTVEIDVKEGVA